MTQPHRKALWLLVALACVHCHTQPEAHSAFEPLSLARDDNGPHSAEESDRARLETALAAGPAQNEPWGPEHAARGATSVAEDASGSTYTPRLCDAPGIGEVEALVGVGAGVRRVDAMLKP